MTRFHQTLVLRAAALCCLLAFVPSVRADDAAGNAAKKMYDLAKPSLVAVKYTWESEIRSQELSAAGLVVDDQGMVMVPIAIVSPPGPESQMKDFKIIIPSDTEDPTEIDAVLQGRDERNNVAFIRPKDPSSRKWTALKFVDVPIDIGDTIYSVGILPKGAGYKATVTTSTVSAILRGPVAQVLVDGRLASTGAVVLNASGQAIGYVHPRSVRDALLDDPSDPESMPMVDSPPRLFIPASDFLQSLQDPPTMGKPLVIPWIGGMEIKGLDSEVADFFGLKNHPAVQIGDVVPNSPADKAGLKPQDIVVAVDGKPLERGDLPEELPEILARKIERMNVGQTVTLSVIRQKGDTPHDLTLTLEAGPMQPNDARRFYAKDLGFVVRQVVFADTYRRKLPPNTGGVVVALLSPQEAASAAHLTANELITQMNGNPVTDIDEFEKDYKQFRKDKPHDPLVLEVSDVNGQSQTINIRPPQTDVVPGMNNQDQ